LRSDALNECRERSGADPGSAPVQIFGEDGMVSEGRGASRGLAWSDIAIGVGVIALSGVLAWQVTQIPPSPLYAAVGPSVFPWIAVGMLAVLGVVLTFQAWTGGWADDEPHDPLDPVGLAWFAGGAILNILLIERIGFILSSTILFICTARAFDSRRTLRDAIVGFLLALVAYAGFDQVLGYRIGDGFVETYVQRFFVWVTPHWEAFRQFLAGLRGRG
jgi:putative tricarboxylic transport membrane protein